MKKILIYVIMPFMLSACENSCGDPSDDHSNTTTPASEQHMNAPGENNMQDTASATH